MSRPIPFIMMAPRVAKRAKLSQLPRMLNLKRTRPAMSMVVRLRMVMRM